MDEFEKFKKQQKKAAASIFEMGQERERKKAAATQGAAAGPASSAVKKPAVSKATSLVKQMRGTPNQQLAAVAAREKQQAKITVGLLQKQVVDLLRRKNERVELSTIQNELGIDIEANEQLFDTLKNNRRLEFDGSAFTFQPEYRCDTKEQLLQLLGDRMENALGGIRVLDLRDSNPRVDDLVKELKAEGSILVVVNEQTKDEVLFFNDTSADFVIDENFRSLWQKVQLKDSVSVQRELEQAGIKAAQHDLTPIPASGGAGGDRKRKKTRRPVTMVNTHMAAIEAQLAGGDKSIPRDESNPFRPK